MPKSGAEPAPAPSVSGAVSHPLAFPAATSAPWRLFRAARSARSAQGWRDLAEALARADRTWGAACAYTRAARRDPVDFPSRHQLARLLHDQGRTEEARAVERELLTINPYDTVALTRLGASLAEEAGSAARHEAEGCLRDADRLGAPATAARLALARLLMDQEREAEVVVLTEQAAAPPLLLQHARAQIALGGFDAAETALTQVLAQEPGNGHAWQQLAALRRHGRAPAAISPANSDDDPIALAEILAEQAEGREREQFAFALGSLREQAGDYAGAWVAYQDANARVRARLPSDIAEIEATDTRIRQTFTANTLNHLARGAVTTPGPVPVFIVGMPRSGTSLLERVLAAHPDAAALGERGDLRDCMGAVTPQEAAARGPWPERAGALAPTAAGAIGGAYLARIHALAPRAKIAIDKLPNNYALVGLIAAIMPQARILYMDRDPRDIAVSNFVAPFHDNLAWTYDLADIFRRQASLEGVMAHWRNLLPEGRLRTVAYGDLVQDPAGIAQAVAAFCGLAPERSRLPEQDDPGAPVRTTSAVQARTPIHTRSVGRWRRFADFCPDLTDYETR